MARHQYHFRTEWRFDAPIATVWEVITDLQSYPAVWSDFRQVTLCAGDGRSPGSIFECETRGALPYTLRYRLEVVRGDIPHRIEVRSSGDLVGTGRWELSTESGTTRATYYWDVAVTRPLLRLMAPLVRPLFARNHDQVMARGEAALRTRIARAAN